LEGGRGAMQGEVPKLGEGKGEGMGGFILKYVSTKSLIFRATWEKRPCLNEGWSDPQEERN